MNRRSLGVFSVLLLYGFLTESDCLAQDRSLKKINWGVTSLSALNEADPSPGVQDDVREASE
jgi:hypothetical protein